MQPPPAMLPTTDLSAGTAAWRWGGDWRARCCRSSSSQAAGQTPAQIGHAGRHGEGGGPGVWGPEGPSIPHSLPYAHSTPKPLSLTHAHSYTHTHTHTCTHFPSPRLHTFPLLAYTLSLSSLTHLPSPRLHTFPLLAVRSGPVLSVSQRPPAARHTPSHAARRHRAAAQLAHGAAPHPRM
jgi:hypothetical protein